MLGTLNPGNLEPEKLHNLEVWAETLEKICHLAILETCNCGILEPCEILDPSLMTLQPWNLGAVELAVGLQSWVKSP